MKTRKTYQLFRKYVIRTPLFPLTDFLNLTNEIRISDKQFKNIISNEVFKEAIYLSTPDFYKLLTDWEKGIITNKKQIQKIKKTTLKYYTRMCSRCTPFGLFAGVSLGEFKEVNSLLVGSLNGNRRNTRLDMDLLVKLKCVLEEDEVIKDQLRYYPNSTIYSVMNKKRYIEFDIKNEKKDVVSVDSSEYLDLILRLATKGKLIQELSDALVAYDKEIELSQAKDFVNELVNNQILVSELEPNLTGIDYFNQIINVLNKIDDNRGYHSVFTQIQEGLCALDNNLGNDISGYEKIKNLLTEIKIDFNPQAIFQTDMVTNFTDNTISDKKAKEILRGLEFLIRINQNIVNSNLESFKEMIIERYGVNEEISISMALDDELGIGYFTNNDYGDINPLVDDLKFSSNTKTKNQNRITWNEVYTILQSKREEGNYTIDLKDEDFENLEVKDFELCDTFSGLAELVNIDGQEMIVFNQAGGSTAGLLLGRFCTVDKEIHDFTLEIIDYEENQVNDNKILAEIVHLPLPRLGNVLRRPNLRNFEIPYLGRSSTSFDKQIRISDLKILVNEKDELLLKYRNKIVLPRLCTAHIHNDNKALPIYRFLCALQYNKREKGVEITFGPLENETVFLPRLQYRNIIFNVARWNLLKENIQDLEFQKDNDELLLLSIKRFRKKFRIPPLITVDDLVINLNNLDSTRLFLDIVRNRAKFQISEFLSNHDQTKRKKKAYTNEFIVSFFKD